MSLCTDSTGTSTISTVHPLPVSTTPVLTVSAREGALRYSYTVYVEIFVVDSFSHILQVSCENKNRGNFSVTSLRTRDMLHIKLWKFAEPAFSQFQEIKSPRTLGRIPYLSQVCCSSYPDELASFPGFPLMSMRARNAPRVSDCKLATAQLGCYITDLVWLTVLYRWL